MKNKLITVLVVIVLLGGGGAFYVWKFIINKPHKSVADEKCIVVTAEDLVKDYSKGDSAANAKYLGKGCEVSGTIDEISKDNGILVVLKTGDPMMAVECSLLDSNITLTKGQNVVIKGFCSGSKMTGVSLTSCQIKK